MTTTITNVSTSQHALPPSLTAAAAAAAASSSTTSSLLSQTSSTVASSAGGGVTSTTGHDAPSPLAVGTRFVKQYYKVLSTTPNQIVRFYQPFSVLSRGVGSMQAQSHLFDSIVGGGTTANGIQQEPHHNDDEGEPDHGHSGITQNGTAASSSSIIANNNATEALFTDRFVLPGYKDCPIRFEFEHGAIDAQESVNGGVLLVVTGHIVYLISKDGEEEDDDEDQRSYHRKAFLHTFFLAGLTLGGKRSYYVHNDVLRFLGEDSDPEPIAAVESVADDAGGMEMAVVEATTEPSAANEIEEEIQAITIENPSRWHKSETVENDADAPGGGVEETKDALLDDDDAPIVDVTNEKQNYDEREQSVLGSQALANSGNTTEEHDSVLYHDDAAVSSEAASTEQEDLGLGHKETAKLGSWASLVARSGGGTATPQPITPTPPTRAAPKPKSTSVPVPASPSPLPAEKDAGLRTFGARQVKRDPDCTLVIKNIGPMTTEPEILGLFEPFASRTDARIVDATVSVLKAIAFVDFDSPAPVLAAVDAHHAEPFQLHERTLDVYQKTLERTRRAPYGRGTGFRGSGVGRLGVSHPNNGAYRGGGSGGGGVGGPGRQPYRRGGTNGGRGDRGTGRGGRGGR